MNLSLQRIGICSNQVISNHAVYCYLYYMTACCGFPRNSRGRSFLLFQSRNNTTFPS